MSDTPTNGRETPVPKQPIVGLPVVVHLNWRTDTTPSNMIEDDLFKEMSFPCLLPVGCELWIKVRPGDGNDCYVVETVEFWEADQEYDEDKRDLFHVQLETVDVPGNVMKQFLERMRDAGWSHSGGFKLLD